ncbi:MAG: MSMEG_1061 family FMN-dependent PPOX-type flavoprotein [Myxococcota bacterium]
MPTADPYRIGSADELQELIGQPNKLTPLKVFGELEATARAFIGRSPFLLLSTSDTAGNQDVSPKGDPAGFVEIVDEKTLLIPDRPGNKLLYGLQNILANPRVGILFLVPGTGETLRVNGRAELTRDPQLLERLAARGKPAQLAIRVFVDECFFHCPKAFLRSELWQPDTWPERQRISFGKLLAKRLGESHEFAEGIDSALEERRNEL